MDGNTSKNNNNQSERAPLQVQEEFQQFQHEELPEEDSVSHDSELLPVAFPISEIQQGTELFNYINSVRNEAASFRNKNKTEARLKYEATEVDHHIKINTMASVHKQNRRLELIEWHRQAHSYFQTTVENVKYLKKSQFNSSIIQDSVNLDRIRKSTYHQLVAQEPLVHQLTNLQYIHVLKLIEKVCDGYLEEETLIRTKKACFWLYSLLSVYRGLEGEKHFDLLSEVNSVIQKALGCPADSEEYGSAQVLLAIAVYEFNQIHLAN